MMYKTLKYVLLALLAAPLFTGCSAWRIKRLINQLKKDPIKVTEESPGKLKHELSPTMQQLVAEGADAVGPLVNSLIKGDSDLRHNVSVMVTLDAMGSEVSGKIFVRLLTHPGLNVPECAAEAIKARPEADLSGLLLEVIKSTDPAAYKMPVANETAFRYAIDCLGAVGTPSALGGLTRIIDHPDPRARQLSMDAVRFIVIRHDVSKVPAKIINSLIRNLSDVRPMVRYVASMVLTVITGEEFGTLSQAGSGPPSAGDTEIRRKWESWWSRRGGGSGR